MRTGYKKGRARYVTPAKYYGRGDVIEKIFAKPHTAGGRPSRVVSDICDFCLPDKIVYIQIRPFQLRLRAKGFKFACSGCFHTMREENNYTMKGKKVIADYRAFVLYEKQRPSQGVQ